MEEHNGHDSMAEVASAERPTDEVAETPKRGSPLFEIVIHPTLAVLNREPLYHFRIWPDGHIEGFEKLGGGAVVHNRLPELLLVMGEPIFVTANTLMDAIHQLTKGSILKNPPRDAATQGDGQSAVREREGGL